MCGTGGLPESSQSDNEDDDEDDVEVDEEGEDEQSETRYRLTADQLDDLVKKMLRPDGSGLQLASGRPRRPIAFDPQQYTPEHRLARLQRSLMQWRAQDGLRDPCTQPRHGAQDGGLNNPEQDPGDIAPSADESRRSPSSSELDAGSPSPLHPAGLSSSLQDEDLVRCRAELRDAVNIGAWDAVTNLSD